MEYGRLDLEGLDILVPKKYPYIAIINASAEVLEDGKSADKLADREGLYKVLKEEGIKAVVCNLSGFKPDEALIYASGFLLSARQAGLECRFTGFEDIPRPECPPKQESESREINGLKYDSIEEAVRSLSKPL